MSSSQPGPLNLENAAERAPAVRAGVAPSPVPLAPSAVPLADRRLERLMSISMASLGSLGAMLLGMGQRSAALPMAVLAAAMISVWVTDIQGWVRLPRRVVNLLATLATLYFFQDFIRTRGALGALLGIADLLCYLQIVLLFQKKDIPTCWSLATLSVVEVLVAAAFSQGFFFGAMLALYLLLGLISLALLFLYQQCGMAEAPPRANEPAAAGSRWPLAGRQPSFERHVAGSPRAAAGRELLWRLTALAGASLLLAMGVFLAFPRLTAGAWRGRGGAVRTSVGFRNRVQLGELGQIIQNPQEVMRLTLLNDATDQPHVAVAEVYLRGAVLADYAHGQWRPSEPTTWGHQYGLRATEVDARPANVLRQQITIEPMDREELFCVWPFENYREQGELAYDYQRERLLRDERRAEDRFTFQLWTTAFRGAVQSEATPAPTWVNRRLLLEMPPDGPDGVPGLVALANEWVREAGVSKDKPYEVAKLLEKRLRDSGRFQYTLDGPARDPSLDPIEDFVTKHPQGHCEYFATALALMLRSQGIPSRLVMGYRTDEYDPVGHFYQVRQLHAHAWVDAHLGRDQEPPAWLDPQELRTWRRRGAWLRLDATPSAAFAEHGKINPVQRAISWLENLWTRYVVDMDRPRQYESIYQPLVDWVRTVCEHLADPEWWRGLLRSLWQSLDPRQWNWFSWRGAATLLVVALAGLLFRRLFRPVWRRWRERRGRGILPERQRRARVAFYRRLESLLARRGLKRLPSQTQREFALEAGPKLAAATGQPHVADLPARVVEAFYEVRFGPGLLAEPQSVAVEEAMAELQRVCQES